MLRTHLAMGLFVAALFWNSVSSKLFFVIALLIATTLPDIDAANSYINNKTKVGKIFGFFSKHRGMFHSMTFAIVLSVLIALISPSIALPVFLGYSLHIFADSFTKDGVQVFWPFGMHSKGRLTTGSWIEYIISGVFLLASILVLTL